MTFFAFAEPGWVWPTHDAPGPWAASLTPPPYNNKIAFLEPLQCLFIDLAISKIDINCANCADAEVKFPGPTKLFLGQPQNSLLELEWSPRTWNKFLNSGLLMYSKRVSRSDGRLQNRLKPQHHIVTGNNTLS